MVNLDEVPYFPQPIIPPQPIHPPQYPVAHQSPAVPYAGSTINHADVFHVQPVALQAVGSPIQAVPLGPAGGKVPYSTPSFSSASLYGESYGPPPRDVHIGPIGSAGPSIHHIGTPRPAYAPPTYEAPSYNPYNVHEDSIQTVYDAPVQKQSDGKTVVQHIHQHTHIYEGGKPSHIDSGYIGSITRPARGDKALPAVSSHHNSLFYSAGSTILVDIFI